MMAALVHVDRGAPVEWPGSAVMACGAFVLFDEVGDATPSGFDFVHSNWPKNATCPECKALTSAPRVHTRKREAA